MSLVETKTRRALLQVTQAGGSLLLLTRFAFTARRIPQLHIFVSTEGVRDNEHVLAVTISSWWRKADAEYNAEQTFSSSGREQSIITAHNARRTRCFGLANVSRGRFCGLGWCERDEC